jgi:serine/threonine protein kinase
VGESTGKRRSTGSSIMAITDKSKGADAPPPDLLAVIRNSGVLTERQLEDIRGKMLKGNYPFDSLELAEKLVREKILTSYQANRLLKNKPHGLAVGRYVILDRIGSGSMGRVYKASHRLMGRVVAIKIVAPEIAGNARIVARFQREMKLVGRLDHPNVVRAYDADQLGQILFIVMEYVDGESLTQKLRAEGPLDPADVVNYIAQAARGLAHAHEMGIVHRDIKPSNLLIGKNQVVKLLDLGLSVLMEADQHSTFETADGIAVGTVDYMSPEQACGKEVDGRSDLYSLGCAMYHLISGRLPFQGDSPIERLGKRIAGLPTPIRQVRPDIPSNVVKVLDKLLATSRRDRYQTAREVAETLEALLEKKPSRSIGETFEDEIPSDEYVEGTSEYARQIDVEDRPRPAGVAKPTWSGKLAAFVERAPWSAVAAVAGAIGVAFAAGVLVGKMFF